MGRSHEFILVLKFAVLAASILLTAGCGGGSATGSPDPLVQDYGIAYVRRPVPATDTADLREPSTFSPGAVLYYRDLASPNARERDVSSRAIGDKGDVKDVEISFDGTKLLFAMRLPEIPGADPADQPTWNLWEYDIQNDQLHRVMTDDIKAEAGQDIAPHYLPDGRIIFSSTRQTRSKAVLLDENKPQFSALDENRNEYALNLHVLEPVTQDIHQVTFNQSHDVDAVVLQSGEVAFSRWDHMGSRNAIHLYKMNPDGTGLQLWYGAQSHNTGTNGATVQFSHPRETEEGQITSILVPFSGAQQGGDVVEIDTANYVENTQPVAANSGILSGPAQTSLSNGQAHSDATPSPGGRFNSFVPLWDGTGRALVSWTPCRLLENTTIVPCTPARLADPSAREAPPIYSVYLFNRRNGTQMPIFAPQEGVMYTDVAAAQPRPLPVVISDKQAVINPVSTDDLDAGLAAEGVGILDIRSVYDLDGVYNGMSSGKPDIGTMADPKETTADQRPARFLRIVKAVSIPDRTFADVTGSLIGVSTGQLMREIVGYAPIEPDGSIRIKVPADVALALSIVDAEGRRVSPRHQSWLSVRPGETRVCNGCHAPSSGLSHGRRDAFTAVYAGAPFNGYQFPHTVSTIFADAGETMAEARTRIDATALNPSMDEIYDDVWTDATAAGRLPDTSFAYRYADLATTAPTSSQCLTAWNGVCRSVINYEQHIQPLWERDRGANSCLNCHSGATPAAELNLTSTASEGGRFDSYNELFIADTVPELDAMGNPVLVDDGNGNLVPKMITILPTMSTAGAIASNAFFSKFEAGGSHEGILDAAELRLLREWLDIGGQYFNNPFDMP